MRVGEVGGLLGEVPRGRGRMRGLCGCYFAGLRRGVGGCVPPRNMSDVDTVSWRVCTRAVYVEGCMVGRGR